MYTSAELCPGPELGPNVKNRFGYPETFTLLYA
ncbi:Uncharacterised protein [Mycobacteroides abscessus subsp. abscessus]|nr:Uncharacterised protein [Mycobacteroides abscessus subsp. abscessus]